MVGPVVGASVSAGAVGASVGGSVTTGPPVGVAVVGDTSACKVGACVPGAGVGCSAVGGKNAGASVKTGGIVAGSAVGKNCNRQKVSMNSTSNKRNPSSKRVPKNLLQQNTRTRTCCWRIRSNFNWLCSRFFCYRLCWTESRLFRSFHCENK